MNTVVKCSIAMTTYNGGFFLREQLNSILVQTVQDFELIICDDCSSDNTWEVLKEYALKDKRIRIYKNEANLGFKKNFEKAIMLCTGDYVALSDQDDVWAPDHLEILFSVMGEKMIACGNSDLIDGNGKKIGLTLKEMELLDNESNNHQKRAYSLVYFRNPYQGASMLIKKEFFSIALPIPDDILYHDAWFSLLSCFYGGMNYTNRIVNQYRLHGHNVTGKRIKRRSRLKSIVYQLVFTRGIMDRPAMLRTVVERVVHIPEEQRMFIKEANQVLTRASSISGRIINTFFRLSHYKDIYS